MANPLQVSVETTKDRWFNFYINKENELVIMSAKAECHIVVTIDEWAIIQKYANEMVSDFTDMPYSQGNNPF